MHFFILLRKRPSAGVHITLLIRIPNKLLKLLYHTFIISHFFYKRHSNTLGIVGAACCSGAKRRNEAERRNPEKPDPTDGEDSCGGTPIFLLPFIPQILLSLLGLGKFIIHCIKKFAQEIFVFNIIDHKHLFGTFVW